MTLSLPVEEAGVYVVEIAAQDRLGRRQSVSADLYVAGDTAVAWEKPKANVFETNTGQNRIRSGRDSQPAPEKSVSEGTYPDRIVEATKSQSVPLG